jgi:DNA-binding NtrC family response regulator
MSDPTTKVMQLPSSFISPFASNTNNSSAISAGQTIEGLEKELIRVTLNKVDGNKTQAAEMLGISTKTLYNRLHAYGDFTD